MAENTVKWRDDLLGVAYRYYDLRMNIVSPKIYKQILNQIKASSGI